ncbi:MAG TPA: M48 family metallopeptidase [Candidatus Dormibacteraeota bacterium]|nr:M48 family metallopeptidase [Candidatus Dormibacteraeota bacterium]
MRGREVLLGLAAGFAAGYLGARSYEAWCELRAPETRHRDGAASYGRVRRALEVADTLQGICGAIAVAYGPVGESVDRATLRAPAWLRPALFVIPLSFCSAAVELPASFVADHLLERRYRLTEQQPAAWLSDYVKGAVISTVITAVGALLLGATVRRSPRWWPLFATLGALPLFVAGNLIVPIYVLPMFNRFDPLDGALEKRLRALASRYGVGDADILKMDMSRQTRKANAFVVGVARTHRIVLGDTLVDSFPDDETEFVVAHELGHYVSKDVWRLTALGDALAGALFFIANAASGPRSGMRDRPIVLARLYAAMLVATQAVRPLLFAFTRAREAAADRFAVEATRNPRAGASAFRRLRDQNLAEDEVPRWYELFFSSHPSLKSRIGALEAMPQDPSSA